MLESSQFISRIEQSYATATRQPTRTEIPPDDDTTMIGIEPARRLSWADKTFDTIPFNLLSHGLLLFGRKVPQHTVEQFTRYIQKNNLISSCGIHGRFQQIEISDWAIGETQRLLQDTDKSPTEVRIIRAGSGLSDRLYRGRVRIICQKGVGRSYLHIQENNIDYRTMVPGTKNYTKHWRIRVGSKIHLFHCRFPMGGRLPIHPKVEQNVITFDKPYGKGKKSWLVHIPGTYDNATRLPHVELISQKEVNEGRRDTLFHTMVSGTTFKLSNLHRLGGAIVWGVEGLRRGKEQKLEHFTVHHGDRPLSDCYPNDDETSQKESQSFEGFDGECEIRVNVSCKRFKDAYEQVSIISRSQHCEFPILSPSEIRIHPWFSDKVDLRRLFHFKASITGDECDDGNWVIRPQINKDGLVLFHRDDGNGLTTNNLTNTECSVKNTKYYPVFSSPRRAHAKIISVTIDDDVTSAGDGDTTIKVTTDCSGLEIPLYAINAMGRTVRHLSSSDNNKTVSDSIRANHKPEKLYEDIKDRELGNETQSDLYVAGFPCQQFSTAGLKKGFGDDKNGGVVKHILRLITECLPKAFLLENADEIRHHDQGNTFKCIIESLEKPDLYNVQLKVINSEDQGVRQNRKRMYIFGILKTCDQGTCAWPETIECGRFTDFLNDRDQVLAHTGTPSDTMTISVQNLRNYVLPMVRDGLDPMGRDFVIACDSSQERAKCWLE